MGKTVKWEHKSDPKLDDRPRKEERMVDRLLQNAAWFWEEYAEGDARHHELKYEPAELEDRNSNL